MKPKKWLVLIEITDTPQGKEPYFTKTQIETEVLHGVSEAGIKKQIVKIEEKE